MNYLYLRASGDFLFTDNSRSFYAHLGTIREVAAHFADTPSIGWCTELESSSDRHVLITTFSTTSELFDTHPELFI